MDRSFSLITAILMFFFCVGIADFGSPRDDNLANLLETNDVVVVNVHNFLMMEEKRLATLRKHIQDYSKEREKALRSVRCHFSEVNLAQSLGVGSNESSIRDNDEIKDEVDEGDISEGDINHLSRYAGTKYEMLCNGEISLPADIQKKLKCRYVNHGNPFLKIGPFKEEEAYLNPRIVLYHDIIYDEEIGAIKRLSEPKLYRAELVNSTTGRSGHSRHRIAKCAWLRDIDNKHVESLSRRVEHMTGLTTESAEFLQVAYYEIGGLYEPHVDYITKEYAKLFQLNDGNRITTIIFYMNDVEKGGGTAFTELNFTVWPKKGMALVWHNLKRNGDGDNLTKHGACPVLSGTKWIANKWLHEKGQEFRRPCTLLENE